MSCSWRSEAEGRWAGGRQQDCRMSYLGEREEARVSKAESQLAGGWVPRGGRDQVGRHPGR